MWDEWSNMQKAVALQVLLGSREMGILLQQDIGYILEKGLAQPQGDNLEQES